MSASSLASTLISQISFLDYLFTVSSSFKALWSWKKQRCLSKTKTNKAKQKTTTKKESTEVYLNRVTRRNNNGVLKIQRSKPKPQQKLQQLLPCQKTILADSIHNIILTNQADANLTSQCYLRTWRKWLDIKKLVDCIFISTYWRERR